MKLLQMKLMEFWSLYQLRKSKLNTRVAGDSDADDKKLNKTTRTNDSSRRSRNISLLSASTGVSIVWDCDDFINDPFFQTDETPVKLKPLF